MEDFWTVEGIAKKLQIDDQTVLRYLRKGTIKGIKVARQWRVPESDLQAYIDGLKAKRDGGE